MWVWLLQGTGRAASLGVQLTRPPAAPAVNVYMPKDRVTNNHQGYGFVEYRGEEDADYVSALAHVHVHALCWAQHSQGAGLSGGRLCGMLCMISTPCRLWGACGWVGGCVLPRWAGGQHT